MKFNDTVKGSALEGFYPAGWDFDRIDACVDAPEKITERQKDWNPDFQPGIDALAIAFGTAHGFYSAQPKLDFDVVKNVAKATGLPLVMHGGSGVSDEGFRNAIANGIRKINYHSYMSKAGYEAAKATIEAGNTKYLHDIEFAAMQAMKENVTTAIRVFAKI